ncbi:hypothetical protein KQ945_05610 [Bacillus subtilis subsp. subtilis]|nr:hypothetical protein [Bacillus subtilis subsp. subtilis]
MRAQDLLPDDQDHVQRDGITVRKGSVGAFLANALLLQDDHTDPATRAVAEQDLLTLLPALRAIGLFEVLAARDPVLQRLIEQAD